MPTKEEIREGIAELIDNLTGDYLPHTQRWVLRDQLIQYLHSQGVAIKVDGELPEITSGKDRLLQGCSEERRQGLYSGYALCEQDMIKAGYTKTVPLIEEISDGN